MIATTFSLLALLSLALLLPACGDGSSSAEEEESGSSQRMAYLEQANGICATLSDELEELAEEQFGDPSKPPSKAERRRYLARARALSERRFTELRQLERPPGDEQQLERIYAALEQSTRELSRQPVGAPGEADAKSALRFQRLAREYGLDACAGT